MFGFLSMANVNKNHALLVNVALIWVLFDKKIEQKERKNGHKTDPITYLIFFFFYKAGSTI